MKIIGKYRVLTLSVSTALMCVVVFSQLFYFQAATYCQKKAATQQQKDKESPVQEAEKTHEAYISIPSNSIASVSHIQISDGLSFVLEILFESEAKQPVPELSLSTNRLFQTLFRFIIATNAP